MNNFLVLGEGPTNDINGSIGAIEKKFSINFSETRTKFFLSLLDSGSNSYLFVNGKEIYKFKADHEIVNFPTQFCLGSLSNKFESEELSFKRNIFDFSVD